MNTWRNVQFLSHKGNANENYTGSPSHPSQNGKHWENQQQCWQGFREDPNTLLKGCELVRPLWMVWRCITKLKTGLPHNPAMALLGLCPKECKPINKRETCTAMLPAALHCSQAVESAKVPNNWQRCIENIWYIYTMEYYSSTMNEIMSCAEKWMELMII
jgi:hypothetical protein